MKRLSLFCLFAVVLDFVILTFFNEHMTLPSELFAAATSFGVLILLLVSFVTGLNAYPREKFRAFVPALICLLGLPTSFFGSIELGGSLQNSRFQRNLPRYTEVVQLIEKGEIKADAPRWHNQLASQYQLPSKYSDLAWSTCSWTNGDGLMIKFSTESAWPIYTAGYLYVPNGHFDTNDNFMKCWPVWFQINTNWFYISD